MIEIDGSQGEGGGQIVRTALSLSAITGTPFRIFHLRAGRKKPGLQRQHLTCVRAAAEICDAELRGAALESSDLTFRPGKLKAGDFRFAIGTAGSTSLVFQTLLPPLMTLPATSSISLEGGTHNDKSPTWDFLQEVYLPFLERIGPKVTTTLERPGFYPNGGGLVRFEVQGASGFRPFSMETRGEVQSVQVRAIVSRLGTHIAERELKTAARWLRDYQPEIELIEERRSPGPGNVVLVSIVSEKGRELFSACGARGVPAEDVAKSAATEALDYLKADVPVGPHLADQLLLPLAIGAGGSFVTQPTTEHTRTNLSVIQRFLEVPIVTTETATGSVRVEVGPRT